VRHWKVISAIVVLLGEGALQISGFQSPSLAILLGFIAIGLLLWSAWPFLKRLRFQSPVHLQGSSKTNVVINTIPIIDSGTCVSVNDKLAVVINAIEKARQITPTGSNVIVFMTDTI
jgi:hypothetical protein